MSDIPRTDLQSALVDHGELHAVFADIDSEVELRTGTTTITSDHIVVEGPDTTHVFSRDDLVAWYRPVSVFHD